MHLSYIHTYSASIKSKSIEKPPDYFLERIVSIPAFVAEYKQHNVEKTGTGSSVQVLTRAKFTNYMNFNPNCHQSTSLNKKRISFTTPSHQHHLNRPHNQIIIAADADIITLCLCLCVCVYACVCPMPTPQRPK